MSVNGFGFEVNSFVTVYLRLLECLVGKLQLLSRIDAVSQTLLGIQHRLAVNVEIWLQKNNCPERN